MIQVSELGYYGNYGGAFIPELLYANVNELNKSYNEFLESDFFKNEFSNLLRDFVGRPTPLYFAKNLSKIYSTKIYLKREDLAHTGSHKINNTIGQILLAKYLNKKRIVAETGAGQHGVATATVCAHMNMECIIYMGEKDIERQFSNVLRMKMLGAKVVPAKSGSKTLKDATNEAIRDWINNSIDTYYLIGSVVGPHPYPDLVAKLQSIISAEIIAQLNYHEDIDFPNRVIACVGGGSNAAGAFYHFLNNSNVELIAVEAAGKGIDTKHTAATIANGNPGILHGSFSMLMQNSDGQITEPYSISAGLDYPGIGPMHSYLNEINRAVYLNATDEEAIEAAFLLTKTEGIIPALESAHALAALKKLTFDKNEVVVVNISGRGDKDLEIYNTYLNK